MKRATLIILAGILLLSPTAAAETSDGTSDGISAAAPYAVEEQLEEVTRYKEYLAEHTGEPRPDDTITVDIPAAVTLAEDAEATWEITVVHGGFYNVRLNYTAVKGKDIDMECALLIDGQLPFTTAAAMNLTRLWKDGKQASFSDDSGNEYRPVQVEEFAEQTAYLSAGDDYLDGSSLFHLSEGVHIITLRCARESFTVNALTFCRQTTPEEYTDYLDGRNPAAIDVEPIKIEGEKAAFKSHPTLYSSADYSSAATSPYDVRRSLQNTIGGESWAAKGQWIEWRFEVKASGFYQMSFRIKQNYKSGSYSVRRLYLDGAVPFDEAADIRFAYALGWSMVTLGGGEPQFLWLDAGAHTLRLEVVYGGFSEVCEEVERCVGEMNMLYRKIMMITGSAPDSLRDYNIEKLVPDCANICRSLSKRLYEVVTQLAALTGGKGAETADIEKTAIQLEQFAKDVEAIPRRMSSFNGNISGMASWLISAAKQPLLLDYILLSPVGSKLPAADVPWYKGAWNELTRFFLSFVEDYDNIRTSTEATEEPVTLWLGVGRDQATVMQSLITGGFTRETGIPVNVRLIAMDVLMRAVASGAGPDLALYQDQSTVINYALRNAVVDLNQFDDIDTVLESFLPEATVPFRMSDKLYALPEQMNFNVMFVRTDVLTELGLDIPKTWDDVYDALTVLQKNKLEVGVSSTFDVVNSTAVSSLYLSFLYQNGGRVYDESGREALLNNPVGVKAFTDFCELYTKHGLSLKIDMLTRFRTGEAPIIINNFSFSNELSVSAPELAGLWKFAALPGIEQPDGTVSNTAILTGSGTVMFSGARNIQNTWRFMKWWTGQNAQSEYARQIETTLGRSGRWTSANLGAMDSVAWSREELTVLKAQMSTARSLPEVAGGYYTGRSINNAIRTVVNQKRDPKETLYEYVRGINKEISHKRRELGLD